MTIEAERLEPAKAAEAVSVPRWAKNQIELAKIVGRTRKTVMRWREESGFPSPAADGRWPVAKVIAWMAENGKENETEDPTRRKTLNLTEEKTIGQRIDNKTRIFRLGVLQKQYIPKDSARRIFAQFIAAAKTRSLSGVPRIVTLIRMASDTPAALEIARQEMMDIWREMENSEWAKTGSKPPKTS
jgi:hypothetical protein